MIVFVQHLLLPSINCLQMSWAHPSAPAHSVTFYNHIQQHHHWREALQWDRWSSLREAPTDHYPDLHHTDPDMYQLFKICSFLNLLREFSVAFFSSTHWNCPPASLFEHQINSRQVVFLQYEVLTLGGGETELLLFCCELTVMILLQSILSSTINGVLALLKKKGAGSAVKSTPKCLYNHVELGLQIPEDYQTACACYT